jgi:hypothetical protein
MTLRRFNFTRRVRIRHEHVKIEIKRGDNGPVTFAASLALESYGFPASARVYIEAYRQTTLMRFAFGTVSLLMPETPLSLADFAVDDGVLFRVKVTSTDEPQGLLLGEADQVPAVRPEEGPDARVPLLSPVPDDLGEELWRLEFEGGVILKVNRNVPDWKQLVRSDTFRALVFPAALNQVLYRVLVKEGFRSTEDLSDWRCRWLYFAGKLPGVGALPAPEADCDDWIESAVSAFARRFSFRIHFLNSAGS